MSRTTSLMVIAALLCGLATTMGGGFAAAHEVKASLRGSKASVKSQYQQALAHGYDLAATPAKVRKLVDLGLLVRLTPNANYSLNRVSYPYVRHAAKLFVERLSRQYRAACREKLVVTSATRSTDRQPRNASTRSVHPAGMAIDFRVPAGACRDWLEENLLALEKADVAEVTREYRPPHYHVAVFSRQYACYLWREKKVRGSYAHYVEEGHVLSAVAAWYCTTVKRLMETNGLSSPDNIRVGQVLTIE